MVENKTRKRFKFDTPKGKSTYLTRYETALGTSFWLSPPQIDDDFKGFVHFYLCYLDGDSPHWHHDAKLLIAPDIQEPEAVHYVYKAPMYPEYQGWKVFPYDADFDTPLHPGNPSKLHQEIVELLRNRDGFIHQLRENTVVE